MCIHHAEIQQAAHTMRSELVTTTIWASITNSGHTMEAEIHHLTFLVDVHLGHLVLLSVSGWPQSTEVWS